MLRLDAAPHITNQRQPAKPAGIPGSNSGVIFRCLYVLSDGFLLLLQIPCSSPSGLRIVNNDPTVVIT